MLCWNRINRMISSQLRRWMARSVSVAMLVAVGAGALVWGTGAFNSAPSKPRPEAVRAVSEPAQANAGAEPAPASPAKRSALPETIGYNRHVRPVLSNNCFACHGEDAEAREAELRLDTFKDATRPIDGSAPIVPGAPDKSEMIRRITSDDPDVVMPPPSSHHDLSQRQIALLKRWIKQGAEYQKHWAYIAPKRPTVPDVEQNDWPLNAIDHFVLAKLERNGIAPAPQADRATLLRRLSLDLTGLPPTPAEVKAFQSDNRPDAYERAVDRLLASDAFGERMAVHWLDQVRYADSAGYHSDPTVDVWAYRDYVIRAFNNNLPFDKFTRQQLAGDLMDDASKRQKIGAAYNRLNKTTDEGGAQPEEYLVKYMIDRINATSGAWLGATMECAQCHDHKYDPYTMKDFYSFGAFFADIKQPGMYGGNKNRDPSLTFTQQKYEDELKAAEQKVEQAERYYQLESSEHEPFNKWYASLQKRVENAEVKATAWLDDKVKEVGKTESVSGKWQYVKADKGPVHSGEFARRQKAGGDKIVQHHFSGAEKTIKADQDTVLYSWVYLDPNDPPKTVMLQFNTGKWRHRAFWGKDKIKYGGIGNDNAAHRPMGALPEAGRWVRLKVPAQKVGLVGKTIEGMAFTQFGGTAYWDDAGLLTAKVEGVPLAVSDVVDRPLDKLNGSQKQDVVKQYRQETEPKRAKRKAKTLADLRQNAKRLRKKATGRVLSTETRRQPRETAILARGSWRNPTDKVVKPDVPEFLGDVSYQGERADRMDLANWLLSKDNPLTTRVVVNRFWRLFFGKALSRTPGDLGTQGDYPTHPKLLDWLATEFRRSGWDMKHMVKLMVMSKAYRMSSRPRDGLRDSDPNNRLLARQNRFRISAEFVRDNALAAAGLLNRERFGPPIKPYQPKDYWQYLNFPKRTYKHDKNDDQWRRGVYMHWQRTFLHPMLKAFDAPNREECTAKRARSNTPLQALVLLNDPTFVEAARVMAENILSQPIEKRAARVAWAFRRAVARKPRDEEIAVLNELYDKHLAHYQKHPEKAKKLISVGLKDRATGFPPAKLAAWTSVSRAILNLHETITRY
jgi:hypothetical protein